MKKISVNLAERSYEILIENKLRDSMGSYIKNIFKGKKVAIITDHNLNDLYGLEIKNNLEKEGFEANIISIKPGEQSKNLEMVSEVYDKLLDLGITRSDLILTLGGGVVGDLGGFVASTFLRGIDFVQMPTSLLAQVDSSVGGKVGVDLPRGKNLVGSFYQPKLVLIDTDTLNTLPKRYFNDGMGEVIKYGCIKDEELFKKLGEIESSEELMKKIDDIVYCCCDIKRKVVENDERDTGERMILNFGHTIGHAIEKGFNFQRFSHGEAVTIGMIMITNISEKLGITEKGTSKKIKDLAIKYDLPYEVELSNKKDILESISMDKKNINNKLNVILLKRIGESFIYGTSLEFFKE